MRTRSLDWMRGRGRFRQLSRFTQSRYRTVNSRRARNTPLNSGWARIANDADHGVSTDVGPSPSCRRSRRQRSSVSVGRSTWNLTARPGLQLIKNAHCRRGSGPRDGCPRQRGFAEELADLDVPGDDRYDAPPWSGRNADRLSSRGNERAPKWWLSCFPTGVQLAAAYGREHRCLASQRRSDSTLIRRSLAEPSAPRSRTSLRWSASDHDRTLLVR